LREITEKRIEDMRKEIQGWLERDIREIKSIQFHRKRNQKSEGGMGKTNGKGKD